jgi:hypothetical protein
MKTHNFFIIISAREMMRHGQHGNCAVSVGVMNGDGLFCIHEISHNALHEYIEGMTEENFVGG